MQTIEDQEKQEVIRRNEEKFDAYVETHMSSVSFCDSKMCRTCITEYRELFVRGAFREERSQEELEARAATGTEEEEVIFPVTCRGDLRCGPGDIKNAEEEDDYVYAGMINPDTWFDQELGIELRWYQSDSAACTSLAKVDRWGRRCLPAGEPVLMADGSSKPIEEVGKGDVVVSFDGLEAVDSMVTDTMENGVKEVFLIRLNDGREIRCTENHPLLRYKNLLAEKHHKNSGTIEPENLNWSSIDSDLNESDQIVVLDKYMKFGSENLENEAMFLGYMLTDGYINATGQTPKFTSCDQVYIDEMSILCQSLFGFDGNKRARKDSKAIDLYLTDGSKGTKSTPLEFFKKVGVTEPKYKHRNIMNYISKFNKYSLSLFVNRAWSGDGCVSLWDAKGKEKFGKRIECSLTSSDYLFVKTLRSILYKVGVTAKISEQRRKSPNSDHVGLYWKLYFADADSIKNFFSFVGEIYGKEENCRAALRELESREFKSKTNYTNDYYLSRIKSIESTGFEETYDITVDKTHNFIVNGIVTHNTGKTHHKVGAFLQRMQLGKGVDERGRIIPEVVLILAPYQAQVDEIFVKIDEMIEGSQTLKGSVARRRQSPNQLLRLENGSRAIGFCTGATQGASSDKTRGQDATIIYADEADYINDADIESFIAITTSKVDTELWFTSTPSGKKTKFWNFCFKEDAKISLSNGLVAPIKDIEEGDEVLDAHGGTDEVANTFEREYDGLMYQFKCKGITSEPCTDEHPYLVKRGDKKSFIAAKDIKKDDYLFIPTAHNPPERIEPIPYRYSDIERKRLLIATSPLGVTEAAREFSVSKSTIRRIRDRYKRYGELGCFDERKMNAYNKAEEFLSSIDRASCDDLLSLLGYYLAEGSEVRKPEGHLTAVQFSFHSDEVPYHNRVRGLMKRVFGIDTKVEIRRERHQAYIFGYSNWIGLVFAHLCGTHAKHKRLHPFLIGINDKAWLESYGHGDGHLKKNGAVHYGTISETLASQVQLATLRLGDYISVAQRKLTSGGNKAYNMDKAAKHADAGYVITDQGMYVKVKSILTERYIGKVYNFETKHTHTYVANSLAVHNCYDKSIGFKEWHIPGTLSPNWNAKTERLLRKQYSSAGWDHEIMALFGEVEGGVFSTKKLVRGLLDYTYENQQRKEGAIYTIGVDWNGAKAGVPIIVIEFDPENNSFTTIDKYISNEEEMTQTRALADVIMMMEKWDADFVYADAGYGRVQEEIFKKYAMDSGKTELLKKYKSIEMHGAMEIRDPLTKRKVPKQNKALMVDLAVQRVEADLCYWPSFENHEGNLVDQLRNFEILRHSQRGIPVYSQGEDHQLIAWCLAIYAMTLEFSDMVKLDGRISLGFIPLKGGRQDLVKQAEEELTYETLKKLMNSGGVPQKKKATVQAGGFARSGMGASRFSNQKGRKLLGNRSF